MDNENRSLATSALDMPASIQEIMAAGSIAAAFGQYSIQFQTGRPVFLALRDLAKSLTRISSAFPAAHLASIKAVVDLELAKAARRYLYHEACGGEVGTRDRPGQIVSIVQSNT